MAAATSRARKRTGIPEGDGDKASSYERAVGARLRRVRQQLGLSLQAVEAMSSQEFRASALGAYERGERSISVPRLQRLATLYHVPADLLLPAPEAGTDAAARPPGDGRPADLETLIASVDEPDRELLRRFVRTIQSQRRDGGSAAGSIRSDDLRALELLLGSAAGRARPNGRD